MADLLPNPTSPLLSRERERERESHPAVHVHNYNTRTLDEYYHLGLYFGLEIKVFQPASDEANKALFFFY